MVRVTLKYTKFHFARDDVKPGMFAMKVIVESYISEVAGSRANQPFGRIQVGTARCVDWHLFLMTCNQCWFKTLI